LNGRFENRPYLAVTSVATVRRLPDAGHFHRQQPERLTERKRLQLGARANHPFRHAEALRSGSCPTSGRRRGAQVNGFPRFPDFTNSQAMSVIFIKTRVGGPSPDGFEAAVKNALACASKTVRNMRWFEVTETRGHIEDGGAIDHW
jgi:flavin-binding protein dodecin